MKKTILSMMLVLLAGTLAMAQTQDEKEVTAAVEQLRKAMVDGDEATLKKLTAKELTYGHSSGLVEDQQAFVDALASGKTDFVTIDLQEQTVSMVGNLALVRHKLFGELAGGSKTGAVGILMVWQKVKGQWKLLARQAYKA